MLRSLLLFVPIALSVGLVGCSSEKQVEHVTHESHSHDDHSAHDKTEASEAFAKLSPADREAATAQKMCPVSDQALGSMGTPIKVVVEGREIFVCCQGCVEELKGNFDEYVAKLDKSHSH
jgi:hypothetical protein